MSAGEVLQFPLSAGIDEGTDPKQQQPGKLLAMRNCVWKKLGRVDKRGGTNGLPKTLVAGGSLGAAKRLFARADELCMTDGSNLYAYSSASAAWTNIDQVPELGLTWTTHLDTNLGVANIDSAIYVGASGSVVVSAYVAGDARVRSSGNLYVQITDAATGSLVMPPVLAQGPGCTGVRVVIIGSNAHVFTKFGATIYVATFGLTTYTFDASNNLRTDAYNAGVTSFHAVAVGSTLVLAYENTTNALKFYSYTYAGITFTQTATGGITSEAGSGFASMAIDATAGESLYITYFVSAPTIKVRLAIADPSTLTQTVAPVDLEVPGGGGFATVENVSVRRLDATHAVACWSGTSTGFISYRATSVLVSSAGAITASSKRGTWSAQFLSHPFFMGTRLYALMLDLTGAGLPATPTTTYIAEIETSSIGAASNFVPHRYVGKIDLLIGGGYGQGFIATPMSVSATQVWLQAPFLATAAIGNGVWRCGSRLVVVSSGADMPTDTWRAVTYGKESYVACCGFSAYDGRLLFDYGISGAVSFTTVAAGGGSMAAGNYGYAVVPEYRSAAGMLHRGPTFVSPLVVAVGAAGQVTLKLASVTVQGKNGVPDGGLTSAQNVLPTMLALYRTLVNGASLFRSTYEPIYNVITDNPLNSSQSFVDNSADASIGVSGVNLGTRPLLYTTGGILDDFQPPACVTMFTHVDRLWILAGDQKTWWFSKAFQDNPGVAPGFQPAFTLVFGDRQVAGASMDDKAIFFSGTGVSWMDGTGPAPSGQPNDFATPRKIQADVGCVNARSLVSFPDGLLFQSTRGIYTLTRALELVWMGKEVRDRLEAFPTITSAVLVPKKNQVRFTCNNAAGSAGIVLVFDYVTGQWSWFEYTDTDAGVASTAIADAILFNGVYTFVTPSGKVYQESETSYLDDATGAPVWVPMSWELAWISSSGMGNAGPIVGRMGYQRMRRAFILGDRYTDCDVTLSFAFDHHAAYAQSYTWTSDKLALINDGVSVGMRVGSQNGANPRCRAFRMKYSDAAPTGPGAVLGTGQGTNVSAVGLEIIPKPGMERRGARARA